MATKKTAAAKVAPTVSPEPDQHDAGGAPDDVTVVVPDGDGDMEDAPPPPAPAPAAPAPTAGTTPGGGPVAGEPHGYAAWVVPAPAALATAAVGSSGWYMGIRAGVEDRAAPFAAWLGTDSPKPSWPN